MADFILIATIIFLFFGLIWKSDHLMNLIIKAGIYIMTAWGGYLLLGAPNLISQLAK